MGKARALRFSTVYGCGLLLLLVSAVRVHGQASISADLGSARIRYADSLSTTATTFSPAFNFVSARTALQLTGSLAQLSSGGWTSQGRFDGTLYTPNAGPLLGEVNVSMGGSAHRDGYHTGQLLGSGRVHLAGTGAGVWLGAGGGGNWDGDVWRSVRQAEAGIWARRSGLSSTLMVSPTAADDTIRYFDSVVSIDWQTHALELNAQAGYRVGDRLPTLGGRDRLWGSINAVSWLTPWAGLVAGVGTYPVDLTQGFPGGRFVTLGVRLRPRPPRAQAIVAVRSNDHSTSVDSTSVDSTVTHAISEFQSSPGSHGKVVLRMRAEQASNVDVAGDFTNWKPLPMTSAGNGWWTITVAVSPGTHQLNARVDNGKWLVPPGLAAVTDEFGGQVGILMVTR